MPRLAQRVTDRLIRWRWPLFALAGVLAVASIGPAMHLQLDQSIERMFAPGDPLLVAYQNLKRTFGGNEVVLVVYRDEDLLDPEGSGLRRVREISERLQRVPGVGAVLGLDRPVSMAARLNERPLDSPLARQFVELFERFTHSEDGQIVSIVVMLIPSDQPPSRVANRSTVCER